MAQGSPPNYWMKKLHSGFNKSSSTELLLGTFSINCNLLLEIPKSFKSLQKLLHRLNAVNRIIAFNDCHWTHLNFYSFCFMLRARHTRIRCHVYNIESKQIRTYI